MTSRSANERPLALLLLFERGVDEPNETSIDAEGTRDDDTDVAR